MRSSALLLGLCLGLSSTASHAGESVQETALVRSALDGGVLHTRIDATRRRGEAAGVSAPLLDNPVLEARLERAKGPAGASTDILGGSVVLGLGGGAEGQAARLRRQAAGAWTRAEVVQAICEVRRSALELWLAAEHADAVDDARARLQKILVDLDELVSAGEAAGYDRDRLALSLSAHRHEIDLATSELWKARATLSALAGRSVDEVELLALAPVGTREEVSEAALSSDPVLQALRDERMAAERALVAARRAGLPELALAGAARWDAAPDGSSPTPGFEVGAGLSLPVFDRHQVEVGARSAAISDLDARIAAREAAVRSSIEAAWQQASALGPAPALPGTASLWQGAADRYAAGESTIDELLTVAADIEAAEVAVRQGEALRRSARLDLSCTAGTFPAPAIQALLEEQTR